MSTTDTRAAFEAAMIALHYPEHMFDGFMAEGEWDYYDPKANIMFDAWQAATEAAKATMPKVEIELPAGDPRKVKIHLDTMKDGVRWLCCTVDDAKATGTAGEHSHQGNRYGNLTDAEYIEMTRQEVARQPAPVAIKTWEERVMLCDIGLTPACQKAMQAEIADLRAALAARSQP